MNITGQSFGRYTILEQLGEGGMATVYKAYDTRLEREVAVKIIRKDAFGLKILENVLKRFEREAKALSKLSHPNIMGVLDYGEYEGSPYLVLEYIPGGTLKQRLGNPFPWREAVRILLPIARALEYAHERGILHRDVKPSNILITDSGEPMLSDFGIAKILEGGEGTLTDTGMGVGTPEYMAAEQWTGKSVPQSDIYSLGVIFFEMITGRKPYTAETPAAILLKQANEPLPRPGGYVSGLPDAVEKVLLKALAKKPEDRYASMGEFAAALETLALSPRAEYETRLVTMSEVMGKDAEAERGRQNEPGLRFSRRWAWGLGIIGILAVLALAAAILISRLPKATAVPSPIAPTSALPVQASPQPVTAIPTVTVPTSAPNPFPKGVLLQETFDDPAFDGKYNPAMWTCSNCSKKTAIQESGHFKFAFDLDYNDNISLVATHSYRADEFTSYEAELMLGGGHTKREDVSVSMTLSTILSDKGVLITCEMYTSGQGFNMAAANCMVVHSTSANGWDSQYATSTKIVNMDEWHRFRIDIDPATFMLSFYMDGELIGQNLPADAEQLLTSTFEFSVGGYTWTQYRGPFTGFADNVTLRAMP